jgi:hypothetical protein
MTRSLEVAALKYARALFTLDEEESALLFQEAQAAFRAAAMDAGTADIRAFPCEANRRILALFEESRPEIVDALVQAVHGVKDVAECAAIIDAEWRRRLPGMADRVARLAADA